MSNRSITKGKTAGLYISGSTIFKSFLLGGVAAISVVFIWFTFNVIEKLKEDTRSQVTKYVKLWQMAANSPTSGDELQFIFDEIIVKANFPIIVLDNDHSPIHWRNIEGIPSDDTTRASFEKLRSISEEMLRDNGEFPLHLDENYVNYFCYGDSEVINQLKMMPCIEIGIVAAFLIVAMIGFQNIRRSEERHIWVGMAKETAHQLGTPISSLMGWLEVMEHECAVPTEASEKDAFITDTAGNMKVDIERLQKIAQRFGQIGSFPELEPCRLNDVVTDVVEYYRRRLPFEGQGIQILFTPTDVPPVALNTELFSWALENMIKNALQAVDAKTGRIMIRSEVEEKSGSVVIEIEDNGKGIPAGAIRKIFRAGFTTKKRGWGLGLTLVKRIIEEYHGGRVSLKRSKPGETLFEICLPVAGEKPCSSQSNNATT